ncbi:hypothetical protein DH2020_017892 [Rehmannia glutinosa]|uniref:Reverse transcriptase domain-containing protein n=1 Tax=Rehmannia glutinosa TaxID=99300 RepID=A0ABR0WLI2_REHGL
MWALHPDFLSTVQANWNLNFWGKAQFILCKKIKALKPSLKELNNSHFSHISSRVKQVKIALKNSQIQLHADPLNSALCDSVKELKAKETFLAKAERSFLSKKLNNGSITSSFDDLSKAFVNYFKNLFGTRLQTSPVDLQTLQTGPCIDEDDFNLLPSPVTPQAIKMALFDIEDDRSPGPDGFSSGFFKKSWDVVGNDVIAAVTEFFDSSKLLRQINHTVIALIPKTDHAPTVADFRPIACCNVVYKVITKILASKLEYVVPKLIDPAQYAFISGRNITDNIFLAQEIIRNYARARISPRCAIKVDLKKAYDTISWSFLEQVLNGLGFSSMFISWVMECVSSASYSICINGSLQGKFPGKRGLRQGDPMSPALFLLCMEYLSRLLKMRTNTSSFKFHPRCEALKITHLVFADDLMVFSKGDIPSIKILIDCLNDFKYASGLDVNSFKSNLFTAGIIGDKLDNILNLVNFPLGTLPVRYLRKLWLLKS